MKEPQEEKLWADEWNANASNEAIKARLLRALVQIKESAWASDGARLSNLAKAFREEGGGAKIDLPERIEVLNRAFDLIGERQWVLKNGRLKNLAKELKAPRVNGPLNSGKAFTKRLKAMLGRAYEATNDPIFFDAARVLDSSSLQDDAAKMGGDFDYYLNCMREQILFWKAQGKRSTVSRAAGYVAAKANVPGITYEAVVKTLRLAYRTREKSGIHAEGDAGFKVHVVPKPGLTIHFPFPDQTAGLEPGRSVGGINVLHPISHFPIVPPEGTTVPYTAYWRRKFAYGQITMGREPPRPSEKT